MFADETIIQLNQKHGQIKDKDQRGLLLRSLMWPVPLPFTQPPGHTYKNFGSATASEFKQLSIVRDIYVSGIVLSLRLLLMSKTYPIKSAKEGPIRQNLKQFKREKNKNDRQQPTTIRAILTLIQIANLIRTGVL